MSVFEALMLICFGAAWPFSIYRSYRSGSNKGKSLVFLLVVLAGYIFGIIHKVLHNMDAVLWLYVLNCAMVLADMLIYYSNRRNMSAVGSMDTGN
jgi:hypothetical protein